MALRRPGKRAIAEHYVAHPWVLAVPQREPPTMTTTLIGTDTAKSGFQVHGVDTAGKPQLKRKLRRKDVIPFFEKQERCMVAL